MVGSFDKADGKCVHDDLKRAMSLISLSVNTNHTMPSKVYIVA
jgi:hypothetical protein